MGHIRRTPEYECLFLIGRVEDGKRDEIASGSFGPDAASAWLHWKEKSKRQWGMLREVRSGEIIASNLRGGA